MGASLLQLALLLVWNHSIAALITVQYVATGLLILVLGIREVVHHLRNSPSREART